MKDQLGQLIRLQEVEIQFSRLDRESKAIPDRIIAAKKALQAAKEEHLSMQAEREAVLKKRLGKEGELEACESKLQKARERQSEIKSNKEYQAHLHEIESLKLDKGKIEEDLLVLMEETDSMKARVDKGSEKLKTAEGEFENTQKSLEEKEKSLKKELEEIESQRQTLSREVEGTVLKRYQKLMAQGRERAVVPVQNGGCGGCHMNLPPQLVAEVKTGQNILNCSQCQRILYWPDQSLNPAPSNPVSPPGLS